MVGRSATDRSRPAATAMTSRHSALHPPAQPSLAGSVFVQAGQLDEPCVPRLCSKVGDASNAAGAAGCAEPVLAMHANVQLACSGGTKASRPAGVHSRQPGGRGGARTRAVPQLYHLPRTAKCVYSNGSIFSVAARAGQAKQTPRTWVHVQGPNVFDGGRHPLAAQSDHLAQLNSALADEHVCGRPGGRACVCGGCMCASAWGGPHAGPGQLPSTCLPGGGNWACRSLCATRSCASSPAAPFRLSTCTSCSQRLQQGGRQGCPLVSVHRKGALEGGPLHAHNKGGELGRTFARSAPTPALPTPPSPPPPAAAAGAAAGPGAPPQRVRHACQGCLPTARQHLAGSPQPPPAAGPAQAAVPRCRCDAPRGCRQPPSQPPARQRRLPAHPQPPPPRAP